jgi:hypothetical protein
MLKEGVIEPSDAEWSSPVVLIPKTDGSLRICVDYRSLNAVTQRDDNPLPRLEECIDSLGNARFFMTLDCNAGFWQIGVHPESRDKTSFKCQAGFFRFRRMPFGLRNAPVTFQRVLGLILSGVRYDFAFVYLDDIIVFSSSFSQHMARLSTVLKLLSDANISLKLKKCHFAKSEVAYLGHMIRPGQLSMMDTKVAAVKKARIP